MSVRTDYFGILANLEAATLIDALQGSVEALQAQLGDYSPCRCGRELSCGPCDREPSDCDCSNVYDDEHEALLDELGPEVGLVHCHDQDDRCLSGHCTGGEA